MLDLVSTAKSTPLSASNAPDSHPRASNEPTLGPLDSSSNGDDAGSPAMSLNEFIDVENGGDGTHRRRTGEELLRFTRASIVPSDSDRHEENPNATDGGAGENHEEEISPAYSMSGGAPTATSRQREPNNCRFRRRSMIRHGLLLDHRTGA